MDRVRGINPRNELRFMVPPAVEREGFIPPFLSFQASKVETSLIWKRTSRALDRQSLIAPGGFEGEVEQPHGFQVVFRPGFCGARASQCIQQVHIRGHDARVGETVARVGPRIRLRSQYF